LSGFSLENVENNINNDDDDDDDDDNSVYMVRVVCGDRFYFKTDLRVSAAICVLYFVVGSAIDETEKISRTYMFRCKTGRQRLAA